MTEPDVVASAADKKKLAEIVKKDEKAGRKLAGFWFAAAAAMGLFMVIFYLWCAATPVDTQYFLGFYVLLTYVLVFFNYSSTENTASSAGILYFVMFLAVCCAIVPVLKGITVAHGWAAAGVTSGYLEDFQVLLKDQFGIAADMASIKSLTGLDLTIEKINDFMNLDVADSWTLEDFQAKYGKAYDPAALMPLHEAAKSTMGWFNFGFLVLKMTAVVAWLWAMGFVGKKFPKVQYFVDNSLPFLAVVFAVYFGFHFFFGTQGAIEPFTGINWYYVVVGIALALVLFLPFRSFGAIGHHVDNGISAICGAVAFYLVIGWMSDVDWMVRYLRIDLWGTGTFLILLSILAGAAMFFLLGRKSEGESLPVAMDSVLALVAFVAVGYFIVEYANINYRMGSETPLDSSISVIGILLSLEVARRVLGWSMTIVGVAFLLYAVWGDMLHMDPILSAFGHSGFTPDRALNHIYFKQEGVFGIMATVLVTYVILFIFFGAFLKKSGASRFFLDLPMALAGRTVGGPAKVAVMASGFFGSVSGSAIANTVSTGAFTIPLMKRAGFRPHVAGAIEPSASIGGMFMPPIMGAGGFIMAEMTEIPYVKIMLMAIFPAVIYFLSVFVMIHFEAKRYGLVGIQDEDAPTAWQILKKEWFMSAPLLVIVILMLLAYSPGMAAYWAIMTCLLVAWLDADFVKGAKEAGRFMVPVVVMMVVHAVSGVGAGVLAVIGLATLAGLLFFTKDINTRDGQLDVKDFLVTAIPSLVFVLIFLVDPDQPAVGAFAALLSYAVISYIVRDPNERWREVIEPMLEGARNTLIIGATVGVIGIIVGTIQLTGIGLKFSQIIIDLSFGYLPLAILLIGLASLVLGMGVPVTAAYLITAVLAVEAVTGMISMTLWGVSFQELQAPLQDLLPDDPQYIAITGKVAWAYIASHMLVYWFSQDSNITPPVCVAAYAGAAIAGSDPWKTGWTSFKFAKMLYIGPFLFAFTPEFLLGGPYHIVPWYEVAVTWFTIILGTIAFGSLTMGYFLCGTTVFEWIIFAVATAMLFFPQLVGWVLGGIEVPTLLVDVIGIGLWAIVYVMQKIRIKKDPTLTLPIGERAKLKEQAAGA